MRAAWSTDILLAIDRDSPATLRGQLESQLRAAIDQARLRAGTMLPSSRELAAWLGLSRGVVVEAYEQLVAEGYIVSRRGSGSRVAARARVGSRPPAPTHHACGAPPRYDFKPGLPDLTAFPHRGWAACLRYAALHASPADLGYPDPRGQIVCRNELAAYLTRARAVVAQPTQVVMCSGFTQGIDLVARVLAERGLERIAIEEPGFGGLAAHLHSHGLQPLRVPVDAQGLDVRQLDRLCAQAVVVAPAHQFPTGAVLGPARRALLVAWARAQGTWIVEDDYDAEFRYEGEPLAALQGAAPERVIYLGTASKVLAPALRLGWIVAPEAWAGALALMKRRVDRGGPAIEQAALARFVELGLLDRHLKRCRTAYRRRRDRLLAALSHWRLVDEVMGSAAGLHVMVRLRAEIDEGRLVAQSRLAGIRVYGGRAYGQALAPALSPTLVLGYGAIDECEIEAGVAALAAVVERCSGVRDDRAAAHRHENLATLGR
jgi:GntR family transcriptional regulator/MocR family aminotransferase